MALIPVAAYATTNLTFSIGTDDHSLAVSSAAILVNQAFAEFQGGREEASYQFPANAKYSIQITYAQDWESDDSLSSVLYDAPREPVAVTFTPKNGGRPFTATVYLTSGNVGGDVGGVATGQATFPCVGKPAMGVAA